MEALFFWSWLLVPVAFLALHHNRARGYAMGASTLRGLAFLLECFGKRPDNDCAEWRNFNRGGRGR